MKCCLLNIHEKTEDSPKCVTTSNGFVGNTRHVGLITPVMSTVSVFCATTVTLTTEMLKAYFYTINTRSSQEDYNILN